MNEENDSVYNLSFDAFCDTVMTGHEIELSILGIPFFIGSYASGTVFCEQNTVQDLSTQIIYRFSSRKQMLDEFKYSGKTFDLLWKDIIITEIM